MADIFDYENNCGLVAFAQVIPDRPEQEIIEACFDAGFEPDIGMLPQQIHRAADLLSLKYEIADLVQLKPSHGHKGDMRNNITLQQALIATSDDVCLIRVSGHVLASNRGIPLDPNVNRRGARRRVLEIMHIHNATIAARHPVIVSANPTIVFDRDLRDETQSKSYRRRVYDKVFGFIGDPAQPVTFDQLRPLGYTRKMMNRHYQRGDIHIIPSAS
jgi:hypothetical protein